MLVTVEMQVMQGLDFDKKKNVWNQEIYFFL